MSRYRLAQSLASDPCDALPAFVRARLSPDVHGPPTPGTADAWRAVREAEARMREEADAGRHFGGSTHRRDGSARKTPFKASTRAHGPKGVVRALTPREP